MGESQASEQRSEPVALRFEASPDLQQSFNELIIKKRRQLASTAFYLYLESSIVDDGEDVQQTIDRYNWQLSRPIKGMMPYYRQFPIEGIDHFPSSDGTSIDFDVRVRTTAQEMDRLRRAPFDANIGTELRLPYRQLCVEMQPLLERTRAYQEMRRALGRGSLYVTHPIAVALPPRIEQRLTR
jgi:hypothetical protein